MSRIFKYELEITDHQVVKMPPLSSVLKVALQNGRLFAWARVDDECESTEEVDFWIVGTGNPIPKMKCDARYTDTVYMDTFSDSSLVFHIFCGPCYD